MLLPPLHGETIGGRAIARWQLARWSKSSAKAGYLGENAKQLLHISPLTPKPLERWKPEHKSGNFASWCQTNPLCSILWKFKRHYQKPLCTLSMRGATGQLRSNLQPEARQLALLQVVVNEEANPDGQWNDADRGSCQHIALVQNYVERDKEEH